MNWKSHEIGVHRIGVARVDSVYPFQGLVPSILLPFLEGMIRDLEAKESSVVTVVEVEERRVCFTSLREMDPSREDSKTIAHTTIIAIWDNILQDLQEACLPNTRFERELEMREPVLLKPAEAAPFCVKGLWAIRDRRTKEVQSYSLSEVAAKAVAAHSQYFEVEYQEGPYEIPEPKEESVLQGRFRKVLESEA